MIKENKIISLAVIGLVLGVIVGVVLNSEEFSVATLAGLGGTAGFLVGWVWNLKSGGSEK